jgi:hypothetical protein
VKYNERIEWRVGYFSSEIDGDGIESHI